MKRIAYMIAAISMLVAPLAPLRAATLAAGDLIKASGPAIYYYHSDGKRYVFPNEKTYFTWYAGFTNIKTITDAELAAVSIGGNVTYRPGVKMIKLTTDPKVYAVDGSNMLRWVKTESLAQSYYGADWAKHIDDLPDAFFADYETGTAIGTTTDYSRTTASEAKPTIGATLVSATVASEVTMTQTKGADFSIDFNSNPTTGYEWTAAFSPSHFTQVSKVYMPASTTLVGSGGTDRYTFTPLVAGTWDIVFSHARPWETGVAPIEVRTYHVNVAEPSVPATPTPTSTVSGTFTLTASKTQAQANESLDLLAETTYTAPITKIEIYVGDLLYTTCDSARTCSMAFTLPGIGLPDAYAYTAKFYTSADGVIDAHASTQVVSLPVNEGILITLGHTQLRDGQAAGILVTLAPNTINASKIVINIDGLDRKTCSPDPQSCRYDDVLSGAVGTTHAVYARVQTPASLQYKSVTKTITMATNDTPTVELTSSNVSILPTETVDITATVSDGDGVSSVSISRDGTILKTCSGAVPCTVTVGPFTSLVAGNQLTFEASGTDLLGATATTSAMLVTIR